MSTDSSTHRGVPRRLLSSVTHPVCETALIDDRSDDAPDTRYLSRSAMETVFARVTALTQGGGDTMVSVESRWTANVRWARNTITTSGDLRTQLLRVTRWIDGAMGVSETTEFDDTALRRTIATAERMTQYSFTDPDAPRMPESQRYLTPTLWSPTTAGVSAQTRADVVFATTHAAAAANVQSAGYLAVGILVRGAWDTQGLATYYASTTAEYTSTVRDEEGSASGWAGMDGSDWTKIDPAALAATAQRKCIDSAQSVAIEPGRMTVILEPQAVYDLMQYVVFALDRQSAEQGFSPFSLGPGQSKLGLKVFDSHVTLRTDPMDPDGGYIPFDRDGTPYRATTWIDRGVLKTLAYDRAYAFEQLGRSEACLNPYAFRIDGGTASVSDMIASAERAVVVTRFHGLNLLDLRTLLLTGNTRDGTWLVERGKITHPVKNFRFTDSPMYIFNNVVQVGVPIRVHAKYAAVVPPMMVHDFNFISLVDAV